VHRSRIDRLDVPARSIFSSPAVFRREALCNIAILSLPPCCNVLLVYCTVGCCLWSFERSWKTSEVRAACLLSFDVHWAVFCKEVRCTYTLKIYRCIGKIVVDQRYGSFGIWNLKFLCIGSTWSKAECAKSSGIQT